MDGFFCSAASQRMENASNAARASGERNRSWKCAFPCAMRAVAPPMSRIGILVTRIASAARQRLRRNAETGCLRAR